MKLAFLKSWVHRAKQYSNDFMERVADGLLEVLLLLIPVAMASFPHAIAGKFQDFANGPDVMLLCAVLFMDGWWKVRAREKLDKDGRAMLELLGVGGAMCTSAITMALYFETLHLTNMSIASNTFICYAREYAFDAAIFYAFWVRVRPDAPPKTKTP